MRTTNHYFYLVTACILLISISFGCKEARQSVTIGAIVSGTEDVILIPMQDSSGKWGYVDTSKTWIIKPQYADAWIFEKGMGIVAVDSLHYGVINKNGNWVLEPKYETVTIMIDSTDVFFLVDTNVNSQIINSEGKSIISSQNKDLSLYFSFGEGLLLVMNDATSLYGFRNKKGDWVIKPKYQFGGNFSEGLACVSDGQKENWIFINNEEETVLRLPEDIHYASNFVNGLALVQKNDKYGYINKLGEVVIDFQYDDAYDFSEGLANVILNDRVKYINTQGITVLNLDSCSSGYRFYMGYASVYNKENKAGLIDRQGNFVLPMIYDAIFVYGKYHHGYFRVQVAGESFYVDLHGNEFRVK